MSSLVTTGTMTTKKAMPSSERVQPHRSIRTLQDFQANRTPRQRLRAYARAWALRLLSLRARRSEPTQDSLQIVYYHHVFDDERDGFRRQLKWMHERGDFVSLDQAIAWLDDDTPVVGRHFCVTFDDGFASCATHALRELEAFDVPAAFFIATDFVDASMQGMHERMHRFFDPPKPISFMTWDDCRRLRDAGMTLGSHTATHQDLINLDAQEVTYELQRSKERLEAELSIPCQHFCAPRGKPGLHYHAGRDPELAERAGYRSFLTTIRGHVRPGFTSPYKVERDHLMANWPMHQLEYFLGR